MKNFNQDFNKSQDDSERDAKRFESVYSKKVRAGKRRTYFFDVRRTRGEDYYLTLTESTKRFNGGYDRHKIFVYKEDFNRFVESLQEVVDHIKTELMPQYDYDEFARRQEEYESRIAAEAEAGLNEESGTDSESEDTASPFKEIRETEQPKVENTFTERIVAKEDMPQYETKAAPRVKDDDDDMSW